jgi:hypothetical protein
VLVFGTGGDTYVNGEGGDDFFLSQFVAGANGTRVNPIVGSLYIDGQNGNDITEIYLAGGNTVCELEI